MKYTHDDLSLLDLGIHGWRRGVVCSVEQNTQQCGDMHSMNNIGVSDARKRISTTNTGTAASAN